MSINGNKVPKKQWGKWSPHAQVVFNYVYEAMQSNPEVYQHPKAGMVTMVHWKTVAWNAAWTAANAADGLMTRAEG